jgi:hypothetical protein
VCRLYLWLRRVFRQALGNLDVSGSNTILRNVLKVSVLRGNKHPYQPTSV